jgi:hypothetical protein
LINDDDHLPAKRKHKVIFEDASMESDAFGSLQYQGLNMDQQPDVVPSTNADTVVDANVRTDWRANFVRAHGREPTSPVPPRHHLGLESPSSRSRGLGVDMTIDEELWQWYASRKQVSDEELALGWLAYLPKLNQTRIKFKLTSQVSGADHAIRPQGNGVSGADNHFDAAHNDDEEPMLLE